MKTTLYLPVLFAVATAVCWGLYGPTLQDARKADADTGAMSSSFKPFVAIGVAYLVLAVGGGLVGMLLQGDKLHFFGGSSRATTLAFAAGFIGALGALALTMAMTSGGKPHVVMPIVFGGAVTVSAIASLIKTGDDLFARPWLLAGIGLMIVSAVIITMNAPHPHPPGKPAAHTDPPAPRSAADSAKSPG